MINQIEAVTKEINDHTKGKASLVVGSTNPIKIQAAKNALGDTDMDVIGCPASSGARPQPLSEEETRQGAINRAKDCLLKTDADFGIGLEAGIFFLNDNIYLCHWGALVDRNENVYISNSPLILLPNEYRKPLLAGQNLGEIMHHSIGIQDLEAKEGAIGIFTENRLNCEQLLTEVVTVLLAQHHYYQEHSQVAIKPEQSPNCIFCKIARQEKKADVVAKFKYCYAMKDAYPVSNGHILIIPYEHTENWFTAREEVRLDIMEAVHKMKEELDLEYAPDGYNIGANCGEIAGQSVMHLHVHLIPRYNGDMADPKGGVRGVIPSKQKY
ncbi:MAG: DUF84 family protein [Simkaniaceae bacterium]|nr:DUF84 family protein [Simkaniaceae bacterium]